MKTINLIPDNYTGNPRNALGYAWATLVMDGWKVNHEQSVPGDDLNISLDECLAMIKAEFGNIAVRDNNNYGWLNQEAEKDGELYEIESLETIAYINCMWCGGASLTVYRVPQSAKKVVKTEKKKEKFILNPAYAHMTSEQIKEAEEDYDNLQNEGYKEGFNPYRDLLYIAEK